MKALLEAPDRNCWSGRRDHAWILLAVQSGLRVSELTKLIRQDITFDTEVRMFTYWARAE